MTKCTQESFDFPPLKRHRIEARFSGGDITSDGGLLLLRQVDRRLGLLEAVNARLPDPREARYVLCQGYEDLNVSMANNFDPLSANKIDPPGATKNQFSRLCFSR